ncbi:MAG TPA: sigma-70 family RNA polymerase sigma factor [Egibacteraceae bacterium]|nr:sigma-70 family RNA polymerase sigma factor [Egibacteraceae bacterium]
MSFEELAAASDEALVAAWVAGDGRAFELLVDRYDRRVYAICYRYFGEAADAEDAAQDAFLALLRRAETFSGASSFSTWMYRVATNACNDLARKRSRRPRSAGVEVEDLADVAIADDVLANRELGLELAEALSALDPEHRAAVVLHDVEGWPYADIAERLGVPVGTVKSRVHRGHARLAARLGEGRPPKDRERFSALRPPTDAT